MLDYLLHRVNIAYHELNEGVRKMFVLGVIESA